MRKIRKKDIQWSFLCFEASPENKIQHTKHFSSKDYLIDENDILYFLRQAGFNKISEDFYVLEEVEIFKNDLIRIAPKNS